jgi:hypothetical protein
MLLLTWPRVPHGPQVSYDYTTFVAKVDQGQVRSVSVGPDGAPEGRLKDGTHFTRASRPPAREVAARGRGPQRSRRLVPVGEGRLALLADPSEHTLPG